MSLEKGMPFCLLQYCLPWGVGYVLACALSHAESRFFHSIANTAPS
jgi:hypothetical protein